MATPSFHYQEPLPLGPDTTEYRLLSKEGISTTQFEGREILKVEPEVLSFVAQQAFRDSAFLLRTSHVKQVAAILEDPEASANDRYVALTMLKNAEIAAEGILPMCQDTGTAAIIGKKGQAVWTGANDAEWLSHGVYDCYTKENLRYSQTAPLDMWNEVNTGTNLPAQIDLYATEGASYEFLFVAKGGGSANKMFLFQETKALLNPKSLASFVEAKLPALGTAACPPYHLVFVIGGTSAESCMKVLKLGTARYLDALPTSGNAHGRAFRDLEWEGEDPRDRSAKRHRGPVWRQVFRDRRARHPDAAPRRELPGGHGRFLQRGPQHQGQDHPGGDFPGEAGDQSGPVHPGRAARPEGEWNRQDRPQPADARDPGRALPPSGDNPRFPDRPADRRARHRARQAEGAARCRQGAARST